VADEGGFPVVVQFAVGNSNSSATVGDIEQTIVAERSMLERMKQTAVIIKQRTSPEKADED